MDSSTEWDVRFTAAAREHIQEIIEYLLEREGREFARSFTSALRNEATERLKTFPFKGRTVPELETLTKEFREIRFTSYRLIYRANPQTRTVRILLIAHIKRDIEDLLLSTILGL